MATYDLIESTSLDIVRFDVSGFPYLFHKKTLLKYPNSRLAQYIKDKRTDKRKSGEDLIVLETDPERFGIIRSLMRDPTNTECLERLSEIELNELEQDLDYYNLPELKRHTKKEQQDLDVTLEALDRVPSSFEQPVVVIMQESMNGLDEIWKDMLKKLQSLKKFAIKVDGLYYGKPEEGTKRQEIFRYFLPAEGPHDDRAPKIYEEDAVWSGGYELIYIAPENFGSSRENFIMFLLALEMYFKSTTPEELLAIEERIPGTRFKRYRSVAVLDIDSSSHESDQDHSMRILEDFFTSQFG